MAKRLVSILFTLVFLAFIVMIDYLPVLQLWNSREQEKAVLDYSTWNDSLKAEQRQQLKEDAQRYNEELATGVGDGPEIPFLDQDGTDPVYGSLLDMDGTGIIGAVRIPKINVNLPVYHGSSEAVLEKGAGHLTGSSLPVGGDSTHTCISAHRGLPTGDLFTDLDLLQPGDIFYLDVLDQSLAYRVYETETVTPDQIDPLKIQNGKDLATLITCTPYGINSHRIYIHGIRITEQEGRDAAQPFSLKGFLRMYWWIILTIFLTGVMIFALYRFNRKSKK